MNFREYTDWERYHWIAFPSVSDWFSRLPDDTRNDTRKAWRKALEDVNLDAARRATDLLLKGDGDKPFGHSEIPAAINRIARGLRQSGGERKSRKPPFRLRTDENGDKVNVYVCRTCRDTGLVAVWHSKSVEAMHDGTFGQRFTDCSAVAHCGECEWGQITTGTYGVVYDSSRHCLFGCHDNHQLNIEELREHCETHSRYGATAWDG